MEPPAIESPGRYLKAKRESKRISLREVADTTRIRESVLRAIEEDRYEELPRLYVKSFLSAYAKNLGLDPNDVITLPQNDVKKIPLPAESHVSRPPQPFLRRKGNVLFWVMSISIALLVALMVYASLEFLPDLMSLVK